mmetsp:Transcript_61933/g.114948  ORF Transcript_61933/g.114948 Transcript_61933/m.114948 type:complete len:204 (-) Transcript_61933:127-738(-)
MRRTICKPVGHLLASTLASARSQRKASTTSSALATMWWLPSSNRAPTSPGVTKASCTRRLRPLLLHSGDRGFALSMSIGTWAQSTYPSVSMTSVALVHQRRDASMAPRMKRAWATNALSTTHQIPSSRSLTSGSTAWRCRLGRPTRSTGHIPVQASVALSTNIRHPSMMGCFVRTLWWPACWTPTMPAPRSTPLACRLKSMLL